ncbi:MAG: TlpA family protein disulfide reductase [Deltaproteobacteria bacterium]|nr:TlpA family protein disulfide reductase [Deltaproteobacteria bacterium]
MRGPRPAAQRSALFACALMVLAASTVATAAPPNANQPTPAAPNAPSRPPPAQPTLAHGRGVSVGVPPPALSANRLHGKDPTELGALAGRVVVLDFWATWCGPCRAVMPLLDRLHRDYHDDGLTVLGVSREPPPRIRAHLNRSPVGYTIARGIGPTWRNYGIRTLPTLVIIGRDGNVRHMMVGVSRRRAAQLVAMIPRLLDEPAP